MDSLTINLFLEDHTADFLSPALSKWFERNGGWDVDINNDLDRFEDNYRDRPHYWTRNGGKFMQFVIDAKAFVSARNYLSTETLVVRSQLVEIADNIKLFGDSVITIIDTSSAGTNIQNFTQQQIDQLDSSLLGVEDCACVQSFSSHMDALHKATLSALDKVSTFQKKIADLKRMISNSLRPNVEGALTFNDPLLQNFFDNAHIVIDDGNKNGNPQITASSLKTMYTKIYNTISSADYIQPLSPLSYGCLRPFLELSEAIFRIQPALSKFEILWIETHSFILNSKQNVDTIQDVKMLKVFRTRMQKIMNDWSNVKTLLGAHPIPLQ